MKDKPISCPLCGKRLIDIKGNVKIQGGSIEAWCKKCKRTIEIYDDCKTKVAEIKSA